MVSFMFEWIKKLFDRKKYLYHGTTLKKLPDIVKNGLDPKMFTRGVISFTEQLGFASFWKLNEEPVVIIVKKKDLDQSLLEPGLMPREWTYPEIIPTKNLIIKRVIVPKFPY